MIVLDVEIKKGILGRNDMPVDADTVEPEDDELDLPRHVSHFSTCPNADQHRKSR